MKGPAYRFQKVLLVRNQPDLVRLAAIDGRQRAVIRRHEILPGGFHQNRPARRSHARVHHYHVNRFPGKVAVRLRDGVGPAADLERRYVVADIHNLRLRADG